MGLCIGITGSCEKKVTDEITAKNVGSGELAVLATPALIAMIEEAAWKSVADELDKGKGTVGTLMNMKHLAATPVGMTVKCETRLTEIDDRRLVFSFKASDEKDVVAEGVCERFIVDNEKFTAKALNKL